MEFLKRIIKLTTIVVIFVIAGAFALLNGTLVQLNYLFGTIHLPLSVLLIIFLVVGWLVGTLNLLPRYLLFKFLAKRKE